MTLSIYFSLSSGAIWKGGRDVDGIDDRGDKGTVTALQRGDELDIGAAGAAAEAQGFELFAVLAVGTAEAEGGEGRLQDHAVQLVAVVDGILHGDTAAHRPAEDDELIPAERLNKLVYVVGEIPHAAGGVHGKGVAVAKAAQIGRCHAELIFQALHDVFIENGGRGVAVY